MELGLDMFGEVLWSGSWSWVWSLLEADEFSGVKWTVLLRRGAGFAGAIDGEYMAWSLR